MIAHEHGWIPQGFFPPLPSTTSWIKNTFNGWFFPEFFLVHVRKINLQIDYIAWCHVYALLNKWRISLLRPPGFLTKFGIECVMSTHALLSKTSPLKNITLRISFSHLRAQAKRSTYSSPKVLSLYVHILDSLTISHGTRKLSCAMNLKFPSHMRHGLPFLYFIYSGIQKNAF